MLELLHKVSERLILLQLDVLQSAYVLLLAIRTQLLRYPGTCSQNSTRDGGTMTESGHVG